MTQLFPVTVPTGTPIGIAQANGLLPSEVQLTGFGTPNPTLLSLLSNGTVSASALFSTVTTGQYGGN
jgi:hypothetical protein